MTMKHGQSRASNGQTSPLRRTPERTGSRTITYQGKRRTESKKKKVSTKTNPGRPLTQKLRRRSSAEPLICRYCGSADLAPSFVKRGDPRCRKCFSKRYGSAARARKLSTRK